MSELRASVVMDLRGNLERQARRYEGSMRQMANAGQRHMGRLQRVTGGLGRQLDRVGNRWVALATGAAGVGVARNLVALEERFTRLGIQSQRSAEDMDALREKIFETARAPDIRVDPGQITSAVEAIVEKTGDLEFAEQNLRNIAAAISATGAEGANIGQIMAEFQKMDVRNPEMVLRAIDTLNEQGQQGAFTLQNLASLGPRVVTAYTALGRTGPEAIREMGAALQVIMQGAGGPEQAATAFEALLRTFQDAEKAKELSRKSGVQIFDPDELERGREVLRPINELMVEIVEAADGRASLLSDVFPDSQAMAAFRQVLAEYNRTGSVPSMERFYEVQGDGTRTMNDSARAADTARGALQSLSTTWQKFADENLSGTIQEAADALNSLEPEAVDRWLKIGGAIAGVTAALYAGRSLYKLGSFYGRLGGGMLGRSTTGGIGGALGGAAGSMAPVPVYVTNWAMRGPGGRGPGGRGPSPTTRKGGGYTPPTNRPTPKPSPSPSPSPSLSSTAIKAATAIGTRAVPVAGAGAVGWTLGSLINDQLIDGTALGDKIGEAVARTLAALGNDEARRAVALNESESTVRIQIDQDGRVRDARAERGDGGPEIDVDLGDWRTMP